MSKYDPLWNHILESGSDEKKMSFQEMEKILGFPVDHAFLRYKKELDAFGYTVGKISMKEQTVAFLKKDGAPWIDT